ncbi:MAG TPA: ABC transporter permease [Planctomycetaceae bacterium]|nr:ABC transporter permease [Planctomycetaceae bacterium]
MIEPGRGWQALELGELWRYRELLFFFVWRDIKVRYKQTELGVLWAVIEPLMTTGVFAVLFGLLLGRGNEPGVRGVPYAVSTFCAMLPWYLFAESTVRASDSLLEGRNMLTKVYFPRILLPLAAVLTGLVDFAIGLVALVVMMICFGVVPTGTVMALPVFILLAVAASLAVGLWLSALSAVYRDFRYVQPFLIRVGLFVSPVLFASSRLAERMQAAVPGWSDALTALYAVNPMVAVIEGFRWSLLGVEWPGWLLVAPSLGMTVSLLVGGLYFFRRMEQTIADVI